MAVHHGRVEGGTPPWTPPLFQTKVTIVGKE